MNNRINSLLQVGTYLDESAMLKEVKENEKMELWRETKRIRMILEKYEARQKNNKEFEIYFPYIKLIQFLNNELYKICFN